MGLRYTLERFRMQLTQRGLPFDYVERAVKELEDHWADLAEEERDKDTNLAEKEATIIGRLGCPNRLANLIVCQYRATSFVGRHPVIIFLAVPVPLALLAWGFCYALWLIVLSAIRAGRVWHASSNPWSLLSQATDNVAQLVSLAIVTCIIFRWSRQAGRGCPWLYAACSQIILLGGLLHTTLRVSEESGPGALTLRLGAPASLLQMLVPLVLGVLLVWLFARARRVVPMP
jgi:hypothetical protein